MKIARWFTAVALGIALAAASFSTLAQAVAGRDYRTLASPQPVTSGSRIEVLEFFYYGCPHCSNLQGPLGAWLKRKPADVEFKRTPAVFQESWLPLTKAYFTIEALALVDKLHHDVFTAIHDKKVRLQDPKVLFDWVAAHGVDRQKFMETYNSFAVQSRSQRAKEVTANYDIPGTPAVIVDGRYLTAPSLTLNPDNSINYERYFKVLDEVIALARKTRSAK